MNTPPNDSAPQPIDGGNSAPLEPRPVAGGGQERGRKVVPTTSRHRGRILALQALYEADTAGHDPAEVVGRLLTEGNAAAPTAAFSRSLIAGIIPARTRLDEYIRSAAPQWPVEQLAVVDRNILRIAIYEMLMGTETPLRVAVNEAVELAKAFGSEASSRFVNGVLGALSALRDEQK